MAERILDVQLPPDAKPGETFRIQMYGPQGEKLDDLQTLSRENMRHPVGLRLLVSLGRIEGFRIHLGKLRNSWFSSSGAISLYNLRKDHRGRPLRKNH